MKRKKVIDQIKNGLIVSCQALENEPLHSSFIMARMAYAAKLGGAVGIRANTVEDITEIKKVVDLPIIGIIKKNYDDSDVCITPTMKEVEALVACGVDIIAMDATKRIRPDGLALEVFFKAVKEEYSEQLFMADCSTYEEGMHAVQMGFDLIATTLNGYTTYTEGASLPNYDLIQRLVADADKPIIAEGGIWTPEQVTQVFEKGVTSVVVGTAITRPMEITKRYVKAIQSNKECSE